MESKMKNLHIRLKFLQDNDWFSTVTDRVAVRMFCVCTVVGIAVQSQEKRRREVQLDVFQKVEDQRFGLGQRE